MPPPDEPITPTRSMPSVSSRASATLEQSLMLVFEAKGVFPYPGRLGIINRNPSFTSWYSNGIMPSHVPPVPWK